MKIKALLISILFIIPGLVMSDEGMWLPFLISEQKYAEMKEMGLKLSKEELFSINNSSLKDAIVMLDEGSCSAELVSKEGLLFTNHHCGYDDIQAHSTVEHDYLTNGFWAMTKEEELPNPGKTASILVRVEDVTKQILAEVSDKMSEEERNSIIHDISEEMISNAIEGSHYNAEVSVMYGGSEFYLFVYETYMDVRLVGAPPSSIGDFGGDTDNWMWPRHTGDFSVFRIYTAPDGSPAEYAPDNIPLHPRHYLPISLNGIEKGDFSMVWGNPGSTDRYLTSFGIKLTLSHVNPSIDRIGSIILSNMKEEMQKNPEVRIQYASKYATMANIWKLYTGQSKWLKRLGVYDEKRELEKEFEQWIEQKEVRKAKYGRVLYGLQNVHIDLRDAEYQKASIYFNMLRNFGIELMDLASQTNSLTEALNSGDQPRIDKAIRLLREEADQFYKDFYLPVDKKNFEFLVKAYMEDVPEFLVADIVPYINEKYDGDVGKYTEYVYSKTLFSTKQSFLEFLEKPSLKKLEKDPMFEFTSSLNRKNRQLKEESLDIYDLLDKSNRKFIQGIREMYADKAFYPDANSTMRLSYGTIQDYYPADAVHYNWQTFMKGIMEKENPDNEEFIVPEKLKEIYRNKDFEPYGEGEKMPVCFITNHDITGGSSGSAVINGNGELIGIAFDSNWEGVSGDIAFNPDQQRCVNVDIRYVLLVIDKFAGATHLVDEMKLVKKQEEEKPEPEMELQED